MTDLKKILIVEDNPYFAANAARVVRKRGYKPLVACDLEDARDIIVNEYIRGRCLSGIITDMQFNEKGISGDSINLEERPDEFIGEEYNPRPVQVDEILSLDNLVLGNWSKDELPYSDQESVVFAFHRALLKSHLKILSDKRADRQKGYDRMYISLQPEIDHELRQDLVKRLTTPELIHDCQRIGHATSKCSQYNMFTEKETKLQKELSEEILKGHEICRFGGAPLGYYVVKDANEKSIPVVAVTGLNHSLHNVPALIACSMTSADEIIFHQDKKRIDVVTFMKSHQMGLARYLEYADFLYGHDKEKYIGKFTDDAQKLIDFNWDRASVFFPKYMAKTILASVKTLRVYDFALDILEGKIDETRPYRVKEEKIK